MKNVLGIFISKANGQKKAHLSRIGCGSTLSFIIKSHMVLFCYLLSTDLGFYDLFMALAHVSKINLLYGSCGLTLKKNQLWNVRKMYKVYFFELS